MAEAVLNRMKREGRAAAAPAHLWHCRRPRTRCWSYRVDEGPGGTGRTHCILAETLRQRGNRVVTNSQFGIGFVFLVMTNTWVIGHAKRRVHLLAKVQVARLPGNRCVPLGIYP